MSAVPPTLHLLVEGQTEDAVVKAVIKPHLEARGWHVRHSIVRTKQTARGTTRRGGVSHWSNLERELRLLLADSSLAALTTVIDYYAFPADAPGMASRPIGDAGWRIRHVEGAIADALDDERVVPHLVLHELEAWVYAAADELGAIRGDTRLAATLTREAGRAGGPELVDDGPDTAPSKRLAVHCPTYVKTADGPQAIAALGLPSLRQRCSHLDAWLTTLDERLAKLTSSVTKDGT